MNTKRKYRIGVIPGEGIGREVVKASVGVLKTLDDLDQDFSLEFHEMDVGERAAAKYGDAIPQETLEGIRGTDTVLFGAVGHPYSATVIRGLRMGFDLFAKVCPIKALPGTQAFRPHTDLIIVRETTEGLYRGTGYVDGDYYVNLRVLTRKGMERVIRFGFELAMKERRKKVTLTHKADALEYTDEPMREMFYVIAKDYPSIRAEDVTIDTCAMQIVMKPEKFDVILAENANGDILSDVGAGVVGGMGLTPSGNFGDSMAIFEPVHGTAPKYAGKNVANPIAAIMSCKMMFDYLGESSVSGRIEQAVCEVLAEEKRQTYDLGGRSSTTEVAEAVSQKIIQNWKET